MSSFHSGERKVHTWASCSILAFLVPTPSSIETAETDLFVILSWMDLCIFVCSVCLLVWDSRGGQAAWSCMWDRGAVIVAQWDGIG